MDDRTYFSLTAEEIKQRAKLTPKEQKAVDNFIAAAKALPKSIVVEVGDNFCGDGNLIVRKRITKGSCQQVASLKKKSLHF